MYELLAFWNKADGLKYDGEYPAMKETDGYTDHNREKGIDIGCYDNDIARLKYPLKLVSASFDGTYEDLSTVSSLVAAIIAASSFIRSNGFLIVQSGSDLFCLYFSESIVICSMLYSDIKLHIIYVIEN